jgi:hypothetical protein
MAKTCPDCHQTYADHLQDCPHCAKDREEDSSVIRLHDPGQTADWGDSPSSSSGERRGDVITIGSEEPSGSTEDSSIEILPPETGKKKTHLAPKGRETKLVGKPTDEADIGQDRPGSDPPKPGARSTPKTMIAPGAKEGTWSTEDSSMEIKLPDQKSDSSIEMGKEKKPGSSFEIALEGTSDSSLEIGKGEKPGSSTEIGREEKSGSSLEIALDKKPGSSVEIALDKESGSSMEIELPKKHDDAGPSSSLLLGGPGSDVGSGKPSSDQMTIGEEARGDDASAVDLGSPARAQVDEVEETMPSDSAVAIETPVAEEPRARAAKKGGAGMGLWIGAGAGVLAASLLWIFGLDGLRASLRETVGLSTGKKTPVASASPQVSARIPQAQPEDESPKGAADEPADTKNVPASINEGEKKKEAEEKKKEVEEKKPAPTPVKEPTEKKPEVPPAPATTVEKPVSEKKVDLLAQVAPAVKLAKERKYPEAAAALQKLRTTAPATDETFLRCCDELVASWQLLDKLGSAGYAAKQGDAVSALDSLLKEKKDAAAAMAAALEKIKSTDPKAENLNQAIDSLVQAAKKADEQVKTAQAGLKNAEKEKEEAQAALTATTNLLKSGNYVDAQAPNPAQGVEKLLADKKNSDAQVRQANSRLKEAEETIQDMIQKLVDAKYLKPGEKPVRTPRAPSQDADLTLAERYYSSGVSHYWSGDYAAAEKELADAIRYYKDDARFFYFLGLACWQEGKREQANEAFQKGNQLEAMSRPSSAQINSTLERIQGPARLAIDQTREHPHARGE